MPRRKGEATRERVLQVAQELFRQKGYQGVSIRAIAQGAGLREASLYYYAPGGKEALYVAVVKRELAGIRQGMEEALGEAEPTVRAQLVAVARWLLQQPPPPLFRLFETDIQFLSKAHREEVVALASESLYAPLARVLRNGVIRGEVRGKDPLLLAVSFVAMVAGVGHGREAGLVLGSGEALAEEVVDLFLHGIAAGPET